MSDQTEKWDKVRSIWEIIDSLRGEPGCPWDRKQTPETVQTYLIEEAHEAATAIRSGNTAEAADELGDLLFMVLFMVHLYEERGAFTLQDVCDAAREKMIRRHPHVFGDVKVSSTREVKENWEKIKASEKDRSGTDGSRVPESLPALMRAYRILSRLGNADSGRWNDPCVSAQTLVDSCTRANELASRGEKPSAQEFGAMLLQVVNLARLSGLRAEDCLHPVLGEVER